MLEIVRSVSLYQASLSTSEMGIQDVILILHALLGLVKKLLKLFQKKPPQEILNWNYLLLHLQVIFKKSRMKNLLITMETLEESYSNLYLKLQQPKPRSKSAWKKTVVAAMMTTRSV